MVCDPSRLPMRAAALFGLALFAALPAFPDEGNDSGSGEAEQTTIGGATEPTGEESWRRFLPETFWYLEPEIRERVAQDPNVVPMYEAAVKARKARRTTAKALFITGTPIFLAGAILILAPEDLGFDPDEVDVISLTCLGVGGLGLILPASLLQGLPSGAEKRFIRYMKDRYGVIPVVEAPRVLPDGRLAWNVVHFTF